jgi:hypothetical protein
VAREVGGRQRVGQVCFDARTAEQNPEFGMGHAGGPSRQGSDQRAAALRRWAALAGDQDHGLPDSVHGVWSLWEISLSAEGFSRKRFLPVFATDDGRTFVPTAKRIWDLLLTESIEIKGTTTAEQAASWFDTSLAAAKNQGERMFAEMLGEHRTGSRKIVNVHCMPSMQEVRPSGELVCPLCVNIAANGSMPSTKRDLPYWTRRKPAFQT